jgi:hypothetical protein
MAHRYRLYKASYGNGTSRVTPDPSNVAVQDVSSVSNSSTKVRAFPSTLRILYVPSLSVLPSTVSSPFTLTFGAEENVILFPSNEIVPI